MEEQLAEMRRSAHTALDCVDSALANYAVLRQGLAALGLGLGSHEAGLVAQKAATEATLRGMELPDGNGVADPMEQMKNIKGFEHS
ncbi:hypothetical protein ON010_g6175 [Phytophthora cinnamomi]|nr:hypothetical protein ON010_g6175 [Phytophthora cinnamomi]